MNVKHRNRNNGHLTMKGKVYMSGGARNTVVNGMILVTFLLHR